MPNVLGRISPWVFLLASVATYAAACFLTALESKMGGPPMIGAECFLMGLLWCWMGLPLLLWSPNLFIVLLWFRTLAGRSTDTRGSFVAPVSAALSTLGCCALYPYRPLTGAWLWIASGAFAGYAAWRVLPEPSGRGVRSVVTRPD